jgi:excisionase family DNA binding protein
VSKKPVDAQVSQERPRLLDLKGSAAYLSSTVTCIRRLVWDKRIAHIRLGKKIMIDRADLDAFVDQQKAVA